MQLLFLFITIITAIFAIYFSVIGGLKMLRFFLFLVVFQNVTVLIFCKFIPTSYNVAFSMIKEIMLYVSLFVCLLILNRGVIPCARREFLYKFGLAVYLVSLLKNVIVTPAELSSVILSLRFMLVPILCVFVGKTMRISYKEKRSLMKDLVRLSLFLSLFGIIELVILRDEFWVSLGYSEYAVKMKGNNVWELFNGVTINFYTWDFFGVPIRRLVSITADPLATAYLVCLGVLILSMGVITRKKNNVFSCDNLCLSLTSLAAVLSFSKAVYVMLSVSLLVCTFCYRWLPKLVLKIIIVIIMLFAIFFIGSCMSGFMGESSIYIHLLGLKNGILNAGLFGCGLGTAGSSVSMLTGAHVDVKESYIGAMISQIGVFGTIGFLIFFYQQAKKIFDIYITTRDPFSVLALCSVVGLVICMMFSDSAVSIMGTGIYFILIGLAQKSVYIKKFGEGLS